MDQVTERLESSITSDEESLSVAQLIGVLVRNWRIILGVPLILAFVTGLWSLSQKRRYEAMLSFVPASEKQSLLTSGAMGLARQFGVNIGASSDQSPQFYVDLIRRPTTLRKTVESAYQMPSLAGTARRGTLIDYYAVPNSIEWPAWQAAVQNLRGDIVASVDRQSGVIEVRVRADHASMAEQIAARLLEIVTEFNLTNRQRRAEEEARFVGGQLERARKQLLDAENDLQNFLTRNRIWQNSPELTFQHDRLERNVTMRQEVYTSLLAVHEQSRIDALRDTPVLTLIDHPTDSAQPQPRGTVLRVMLALIIGFALASVLALVVELRRAPGAQRGEVGAAVSEAWTDLRNPKRWFKTGQSRVAGA